MSGCFRGLSADLSSSPDVLQSCRTGPWAVESHWGQSGDSQELCSYGRRTLFVVGTLHVEGAAVPWAAEFLGAAGASLAAELLPGRQMLGKRDSFIENCFTDCFGQLPRLPYKSRPPKKM